MLKMKFVGAVEGVSGSCTWLHHTDSDTQFLVDCGMFQGDDLAKWRNEQQFPFDPLKLKYVFLTHAHIDHCGLLPKLVRKKFCGLVYATRATRELAEVMLRDAAKVNGNKDDIKYIEAIKWSVIDDDAGFKWGRAIRMAEGLWFAALRSSHVLGACGISIGWQTKDQKGDFDPDSDKFIFFSGDIGPQCDENPYLPLLKPGQVPFANTDYIVMEATYGSRNRDKQFQCSKTRRERLADVILHTVQNKGGKVILPTFSLQRTQELLADLYWLASKNSVVQNSDIKFGERSNYREDNKIIIVIDSPLGTKITHVYKKYLFQLSPNGKYKFYNAIATDSSINEYEAFLNCLCENKSTIFNNSYLIKLADPTPDKKSFSMIGRQRLNQLEGKFRDFDVVVASSGMCDAGPVIEYLERLGNDPANTIVMTGYQSPGTKGKELMTRATKSCQDPSILPVGQAEVIDMSGFYSAHADKNQLLDFLFALDRDRTSVPAKVYINHGDAASKDDLAASIKERASHKMSSERAIRDVCFADTLWIDLNCDEYIANPPEDLSCVPDELMANIAAMSAEIRTLKNMLEKLLDRVPA